jgi:hypothetical protein
MSEASVGDPSPSPNWGGGGPAPILTSFPSATGGSPWITNVLHWVIGRDHEEAVRLPASRGKPTLSLVDCVSFVLMRKYRITTAFAFDEDFEREGFQLLS